MYSSNLYRIIFLLVPYNMDALMSNNSKNKPLNEIISKHLEFNIYKFNYND